MRAPVPVEATIDVPDGLPPHVETAVYFVVAEALTNVAKHSGATRTTVGVWVEDGGVEVRVEDDGTGGAHPAKGSGLAGLQQRVLAARRPRSRSAHPRAARPWSVPGCPS